MLEIDTDTIEYGHDGHVATITLNRPKQLNALTVEMRESVARCLYDADDHEDIRAIIVTGAGDAFCSGMDLDSMSIKETERMVDLDSGFQDFTLRNEPIFTPIIAAVNGHCIAAGMEFLQATDIRIAADDAMFGLQEPKWGFVPSTGSTVRLPRQIPYCHAMEFFFTGDLFPAEHAKEVGLINKVVPTEDVQNHAEAVAEKITHNSPDAIRTIKKIVQRGMNRTMTEAFHIESELGREALESDDIKEGQRAYEKGQRPEY
jgi:enoyl-CoA hydratase